MKKVHRNIIAGLLTGIYFLISVSSLAPLALGSASVAHAVSGECSGDCEIDGCDPASRASHSCCCWKKKTKELEEKKKQRDCCGKKKQQAKTVLKCNCPCGKSKQSALFSSEKFEQLPYRFSDTSIVPLEGTHSFPFHPRLTTRSIEPLTPPPEDSPLS